MEVININSLPEMLRLPFFKSSAKLLFLLSLVLMCCEASAQVKNINGMVVDNNGRLSNAVVHNLETGNKIVSNMMGQFTIRAKNGDTIITTSINYKPDTLIINNQDNVIVKLKSLARVLREVVIKDSLLGPSKTYANNKVAYKYIYWKGDKSNIVSVGGGFGIMVSVNIDKLYNAISKEGKDARKLQRTLAKDYKNDVVDQHFTRSLVGRITGYSGDKLSDFIVKYRPTYEFVSKANGYDIIRYIRKKLALDIKTGNDVNSSGSGIAALKGPG